MKIKNLLKNFPVFAGVAVLALICAIITLAKGLKWLAVIEFVILAAAVVFLFLYFDVINARKQKMLNQISAGLDFLGNGDSGDFPLPVVVCGKNGEILWFNSLFEEKVAGSHSAGYAEMSANFREMGIDAIVDSAAGITIECDGRFYNVYSHRAKKDGEDVAVMYLVDITTSKRVTDEFIKTRPAVAILTIDNISELQQEYRESDCAAIRNGIEKIIEEWVSGYPCFISKVSDSRFYIVAEKQDVDDMIERKFDVLDLVRSYTYDKKFVGATLSIGIGNGSDLNECENAAKLSLDMALGRGGDQAVVRTKDNYEFFGGVSKSVESGNKVKSRIVASALSELISGCDNVFIMGHRFPDFDAMGAAFGIAFIARTLGVNAYIVTDKSKSMAKSLLERAENEGLGSLIVSLDEAKQLKSQSRKNLLVVADTHIVNFVEFTDFLSESDMTVVIDHHRKAVDYIKDSVIFFHDPSASSASEMVAELIEYTPDTPVPDGLTADALMAGIMLDTKNFILRSTPRTFEAAAFLKSQGADTVRVKKLFANDIDSHYARNRIISAAKKFQNCAIAVTAEESDDIRMISAQAADELLNVCGVDASFVIFSIGDMICISARSFGAVNVQVLMEQLGGGGHQTMAAAQIKNSDFEKVTADLMHKIESYNENTKKEVSE